MRLLVQRVKNAEVAVDGKIVAKIKKGFLVLCGITHTDTKKEVEYLAKKLCNLRVFEDENDKMNLSIQDIKGELLIVSQFTLYANCLSGNRPSFTDSAKPEQAEELYEYFVAQCEAQNGKVQKGIFRAHMEVSLLNDGPVTIMLEK